MNNIPYVLGLLCLSAFIFSSCEKDDPETIAGSTTVIADHTIAHEDILRSIPDEYINAARNDLHIAYQHTSHGTHVSRGLFGLPDYKAGDDIRYAISNNDPQDDKLDFRDYALESYAEPGVDASDLSRNETAFIQATRNYLDDPDNSEINVVMWSWCNIAGHDVATNYLPGMQTLINEYPSVAFIFMTGHANQGANVGDDNPKNQADLIIDYCKENKFYCLDYYGIDTHDMAGNYWEDAGDDGTPQQVATITQIGRTVTALEMAISKTEEHQAVALLMVLTIHNILLPIARLMPCGTFLLPLPAGMEITKIPLE